MQEDAREIIALGSEFRKRGPSRPSIADLEAMLRRLVRVDTSATAPIDALGALRAGRAQPDGFVRLFVAVLRASGVPSRLVIGVSPLGDQLRTHVWAEVRESRGTGWLAVDPLFGRVPASTSLIRLSFGGSSHPEEMLALLADVTFIALGHSESLP
jgi:transglutaminase-like putative cysteine protease